MRTMTVFETRELAQRAVQADGYTKFEGLGEAGDGGYGSREYWSRPGCEVNQFGCPMEIATLSHYADGWCTFDLPGEDTTGPYPIV